MEEAAGALRDVAVALAQAALEDEQHAADPAKHRERKRALAEQGALLLMRLREAYRAEALAAERARDGAAQQRQRLDSASLQLRNLLYELGHYGREVQACRGFSSAVPEEALGGLVSEEEFAAAEPEAYAAAMAAGGGAVDDGGIDEGKGGKAAAAAAGSDAAAAEQTRSRHALMLARLAHELETRKRLARRVAELKRDKAAEAAAVGAARSALEELQHHLKAVGGAARPLTEALAAGAEGSAGGGAAAGAVVAAGAAAGQQQQPSWALAATLRHNAPRAALLPLPLYIVYAQFVAAADALGLPVEVSISGSIEEAQQEQQRQQGGGSNATLALTAAATTPPSSSNSDPAAAAQALFAVHPLTVDVRVLRPGTAEQLAGLAFGYYPRLRVAGACAADSEDAALLRALFPGDPGDGAGMEGLAMVLAAAGVTPELAMASAGVPVVGGGAAAGAATAELCAPYGFGGPGRRLRPYLWVQDLAGLDFVSTLPPAAFQPAAGGDEPGSAEARGAALAALAQYRREQRVQTVVERLASAKAGAAALK
jgi:THO complex subunit 5